MNLVSLYNCTIFFVFLFGFTSQLFGHGYSEADKLQRLIEFHSQTSSDYSCESSWKSYIAENASYLAKIEVEKNKTLYLMPCSYWAINFVSMAYLLEVHSKNMYSITRKKVYHESPYRDDSYWTEELSHVQFYQGELYTTFYVDSRSKCGTLAKYAWNKKSDALEVQAIEVFRDCQ